MKSLIVAFLLSTSVFANSFFQEEDKQQHVQATAIISFMTSIVVNDMDFTPTEAFWISVAAGMLVGTAKEVYDSRSGGSGFDMRDIAADSIGSLVGSTPMFIIYKW